MRLGAGLLGLMVCGAGLAGAQETAAAAKPLGWLLVLDKPYEGVREYNREQKHADGSTYKLHETQRYWRNSAGQLREEISRDRERAIWTYFTDPTAKVQYRWNNLAKVVYVSKLGEPIPAHEATHPLVAGESREYTTTVNGQKVKGTASLLPPKTIDGKETIGSRSVLYSDPDRKTVLSSTDRWFEPEYHVTLEEDITDQQYGHRMFLWKSFKGTEPKADLFKVPKGYAVKQAETADTEQFE